MRRDSTSAANPRTSPFALIIIKAMVERGQGAPWRRLSVGMIWAVGLALVSVVVLEGLQPRAPRTPAPWFNTAGCALKQKPYVFADGSIIPNSPSQVLCREVIKVCGTTIERKKVVGTNGTGECFKASDVSKPEVCCATWTRSLGRPDCDPVQDADCDGVPNQQDDDPFAPAASKEKCKISADQIRAAFNGALQASGVSMPPEYLNVRDAGTTLIKFDAGLGRNKNLLPTFSWVNAQMASGNIKPGTPEAPAFILLGSIQVICGQGIRVNIRINSVETTAILDAATGTSTTVDASGLDAAVSKALAGLTTRLAK